MEGNGYTAKISDESNLAAVKTQYNIPLELQSCHTAIVDGYIVEGHVPIEVVEKLLAERPDVVGIAVPGMPIGSPGMEVEGRPDQPFDVLAFDDGGQITVFASFP